MSSFEMNCFGGFGKRVGSVVPVVALAGLFVLAGCRSETSTPPEEANANLSSSPGIGRPVESGPIASTHPATQAAMPMPSDPGGCLTSGCHQGLAMVSFRHGPFQAGACNACHEPEQPGHKFPLKRPGRETCTFCHQIGGHLAYQHEVMARVGCLPCHNPHGSDTKFLLTSASTELTCQQCHVVERRAHLHGPFAGGQCTACHQPHESDNEFLLTGGGGADHCFQCHRIQQRHIAAATTIHDPVKQGCRHCHEPHSSANEHLLTHPIEELCFECHRDVEGQVASAQSPHGAVFTGDRCANCHDPHGAGRPSLLRDEMRDLCLKCHDKPQQAYDGHTIPDMRPAIIERKYLHGPVRNGQCDACHEVHGASYANLLRKYFPPEFYERFDLSNYALCFECHSQAMVLEKQTGSFTNFRDGDRNLHFVHVNRADKGRSCRTCHEIHGSNLPRHMASEVPFEGGGWSMPIKFETTATGGRCSPGCHAPMEYKRVPVAPIPARPSVSPSEERISP